ncbi:hypothetical protein P7H46_03405 [Enterococcus pseudoavium]|uniref:Uncharacterized protein n=2 Tax=Enterococcus TaxID=1350 RepID=A0ABU3FGN1_9ENTE|nr:MULTISPECIES: hypothetical protein [Enterococcus]MDT2604704.1 hypothetical protein [Enterococcus dongliensis]MDT2760479.1 hypothetical protein [Enterococcus xiangfangensis]MDT2769885.1 hypothetical protein [Enterococcus pseudoavium]
MNDIKREIARLKKLIKPYEFEPVILLDTEAAEEFDFESVDPKTVIFIDDISSKGGLEE